MMYALRILAIVILNLKTHVNIRTKNLMITMNVLKILVILLKDLPTNLLFVMMATLVLPILVILIRVVFILQFLMKFATITINAQTILVILNKDVLLDASTNLLTVMIMISVLMILVILLLDVNTLHIAVMIITLVLRMYVKMENVNILILFVTTTMNVLLMTVTAKQDAPTHLFLKIIAMIQTNATLNTVILPKAVSTKK
jgi:hypothetical protein